MARTTLRLKTRLGDIMIDAGCNPEGTEIADVYLVSTEFSPRLRSGMSVDRCRAILLTVRSHLQLADVTLRCELNSKHVGYPCTGEWLEAQQWGDDTYAVVAGTEDAQILSSRVPFLNLSAYEQIATYTPQAMTVRIQEVPPSEVLTLHVIVAEKALSNPEDVSAWFAVDQRHEFVRALHDA